MMEVLKDYVRNNSERLFKHLHEDSEIAICDSKGFFFSDSALTRYNVIKHQPHLYVAWTETPQGQYYIGKSYQNGGRWKRQHAYHLGILAHHVLNTIQSDDQNHQHWIRNWFFPNSLICGGINEYTIRLQNEVKISFIPFDLYSTENYSILSKQEIRLRNTLAEKTLIDSYIKDNKVLLNVQNNRR